NVPFADGSGVAIKVKAVGHDLTGDNAFAEAPRRLDEHTPSLQIERVAREQDPGNFGGNKALDDDGHRQAISRDSLLPAISTGPLRLERVPATGNSVEEVLLADDAQNGFLLPGKTVD